MNSKLEELRLIKTRLVDKNKLQLEELKKKAMAANSQNPSTSNGTTSTSSNLNPIKSQNKPNRFGIIESDAIHIFFQKQEEKKIKLEEGVMANTDKEMLRLHQATEEADASQSSEELSKDEDEANTDIYKFKVTIGTANVSNQNKSTNYLTDGQTSDLFHEKEEHLAKFFKSVEKMLNTEFAQRKNEGLIEDYLFNLNNQGRDQRKDYSVRRLVDPDLEGKYMVNDIVCQAQKEGESDNIVVCYSKLEENKESLETPDFFFGVYANDKRFVTKSFRSEIKRVILDKDNSNLIYGGIDNGRIALWDLRSSKQIPDSMTSPRDKIAFLPIIDLKKRDFEIFAVAQEGRIHKFDIRKLYEPVFSMDLFIVSDSHSIVKLESMPSCLEFDPFDPETLYVSSTEGTVYEIGINQNNFQEKMLFQKIADGPITNLQIMDFKSFFREQNALRKTQLPTKMKYPNFFVTSSFDWTVRFFKDSFSTEAFSSTFHNDFVSALDVNNQLCPFTYASGDVEGKLAVWKIDQSHVNQPVCEWSNPNSISKIRWNSSGLELAVGDVKGVVNILSFSRTKLMISDKMYNYYAANGFGKLMSD